MESYSFCTQQFCPTFTTCIHTFRHISQDYLSISSSFFFCLYDNYFMQTCWTHTHTQTLKHTYIRLLSAFCSLICSYLWREFYLFILHYKNYIIFFFVQEKYDTICALINCFTFFLCLPQRSVWHWAKEREWELKIARIVLSAGILFGFSFCHKYFLPLATVSKGNFI